MSRLERGPKTDMQEASGGIKKGRRISGLKWSSEAGMGVQNEALSKWGCVGDLHPCHTPCLLGTRSPLQSGDLSMAYLEASKLLPQIVGVYRPK